MIAHALELSDVGTMFVLIVMLQIIKDKRKEHVGLIVNVLVHFYVIKVLVKIAMGQNTRVKLLEKDVAMTVIAMVFSIALKVNAKIAITQITQVLH